MRTSLAAFALWMMAMPVSVEAAQDPVAQACAADIQRYTTEIPRLCEFHAGAGRAACLRDNRAVLSAACNTALNSYFQGLIYTEGNATNNATPAQGAGGGQRGAGGN